MEMPETGNPFFHTLESLTHDLSKKYETSPMDSNEGTEMYESSKKEVRREDQLMGSILQEAKTVLESSRNGKIINLLSIIFP